MFPFHFLQNVTEGQLRLRHCSLNCIFFRHGKRASGAVSYDLHIYKFVLMLNDMVGLVWMHLTSNLVSPAEATKCPVVTLTNMFSAHIQGWPVQMVQLDFTLGS